MAFKFIFRFCKPLIKGRKKTFNNWKNFKIALIITIFLKTFLQIFQPVISEKKIRKKVLCEH